MQIIHQEITYSKRDIDKAYAMGLESAVVVLEKSIGLSPSDQRYILDRLKESIIDDKVAASINTK